MNGRITLPRYGLLGWCGLFLILAAGARVFHAAWVDGSDFIVYWKAARNLVWGPNSPYFIEPGSRGFIFKYPPWMLPLFVPLAFMAEQVAKMFWAVLQAGSLAYTLRWLYRRGVAPLRLWIAGLLFWWIWLAHFYSSQFTLILLAVSLWGFEAATSKKSPGRLSVAAIVLSAKVFPAIALLGIWREFLRLVIWIRMAGIVLGGWLIATGLAQLHSDTSFAATFVGLLKGWQVAAATSGLELGETVVRGQMNHGFTAAVLRWLRVPASEVRADLAVAALLTALLAPLWMRTSAPLKPEHRWAGWLALAMVVNPLTWHHSYVLAFPLCCFALQSTAALPQAKDKRLSTGLAYLGIFLIGIFIPNVFGLALVTPFELLSSKSWGVVLCAVSLVLSERKLKAPRP